MKTYTYGDTLELPGIPGVVWQVSDRRKLDEAGSNNETRAYLVPFSVYGELAKYGTPIKIGRAERLGVRIGLRMGSYDTQTQSYDLARLNCYGQSNGSGINLTESQQELITKAVHSLYLHIPPLSDDEIRERYIAKAASAAGSAQTNRLLPYAGDVRIRVETVLRKGDRERALAAALIEFEVHMRRELGLR